jgi:EAL domain-containing protein (putative c-di-GMP-specific phosphodiesterase class I)
MISSDISLLEKLARLEAGVDPKIQQTVSERARIEQELRDAIEKQQFQLYYQVQVDQANKVLGAEALIRRKHPEKGLLMPSAFIPLAEATRLIIPIGEWVINTACAQLKAWQLNEATRNLTLAVNVSAKQFHETSFSSMVQRGVQLNSINPKLLKLEITESILLENIEGAVCTMFELREIGITFALDDFGTGFSSLQYLKLLPLDQLKIDQSFVRYIAIDSNDQAIVQTIIAMARSFNIEVIAVGVETEEQQLFLQDYGCDHFQGFKFGRPMPIEQFNEFLASEN